MYIGAVIPTKEVASLVLRHLDQRKGPFVVTSENSGSGLGGQVLVMLPGLEPPAGNNGGSSYKSVVLLDWLRVRLPDNRDTWRGLSVYLGEWEPRPQGWRGFYDRSAAVLDGGLIAWCSDRSRAEVQGVLVDLGSRALAVLGTQVTGFMRWCVSVGGVFTRVDWAIDDRVGFLTLDRLVSAERDGRIVSRFQEFSLVQKRVRGEHGGWTVYLGSRSSMAFVRIYDKAAEQGVSGHWVRFELECKGRFADAITRGVLDRDCSVVIEQINRRLRFVAPVGDDSNMRRASWAGWWVSFLGSVVTVGESLLVGDERVLTMDRVKAWLDTCVGPTLATVLEQEDGLLWIGKRLESWRSRWGMRHRLILASASVGV